MADIRQESRQFLKVRALPYGLLPGLTFAVGIALLKDYSWLNYDVGFLVWAADQMVSTPSVFGVDILEVSPPLCVMLYIPAALLAKFVGFDWGMRLWLMAIAALSVTAFWHVADRTLRTPLVITLILFVLLCYPDSLAEKDQLLLLLCVPYVAGHSPRRTWAVTSGVMAAAGFFAKPHFVIPLAMLLVLRRRFATEEKVILALGILYAVVMLVFFRPYLYEMVPAAQATYWATAFPAIIMWSEASLVLLSAIPLYAASASQPAARPYFIAVVGFTAAAVAQARGFYYHFIPPFAFLALFLAAMMRNPNRFVAWVAAGFLLVEAISLGTRSLQWLASRPLLAAFETRMLEALATSDSYLVLTTEPFPGFPLAQKTPSRFVGIAISQIFQPAVRLHLKGEATGDPSDAIRLALDQARRELARNPGLVIVSSVDRDGNPMDMLDWLNRDPTFAAMWKHYAFEGRIGLFELYRRR